MTTRLNLLPRLRLRGSIPPLSLYIFMACCLTKQWFLLTSLFHIGTHIKRTNSFPTDFSCLCRLCTYIKLIYSLTCSFICFYVCFVEICSSEKQRDILTVGFLTFNPSHYSTSLIILWSSSTASRTAVGTTQYPLQWILGSLFVEVKRPGREADHSSPSSVEVNAWRYTSAPPIRFMEWCLVKHRDNFAFTFNFYSLFISLTLILFSLSVRLS